MRTSFLSA